MRKVAVFLAVFTLFGADAKLTPEMQSVVGRISADSLRGHLSFIASDALEGRGTPSRGLDLAAEYIAAQFRRAGLEPVGDDGYFQTATVIVREQNPEGFELTVSAKGETIHIPPAETAIFPDKALDLNNVPLDTIEGRDIFLAGRARSTQVFDPEAPRRPSRNVVAAPELLAFLKGASDARVTLHVQPPIEHAAKVRNVGGILRGSDPALRNTYVMLTAHYDHLGTRSTGEDRIYNGANDDGSGTVSVIEIASALAAQNPHPKRSIMFVALFGEEQGLLGSRYYARHPLVPLADTIADLNLEQVGRTDDSDGPQVATATITGFDFSDMTKPLIDAGRLTGVKIYKSEKNSDPYFARSDNQALAEAGIPAHTLSVAFDYPDYHGVGDEWQKIDYANMAKIDRTVAVGLLELASDAPPPHWNAANPKVKKYVDLAEKLRKN